VKESIDLTSERTEQLWIDSPSHFLSWPCCLDDPLLLCAGRSVSRSKHCDGAEVLDNPLHTRKHTKVRLVHFDRLWLNTSGRRSLLASRSRVLPSWPQYNQHTLHYSPDSSQSGKQTFASLQPPYTPRRWQPPIHGQGCRSPAQLLTAFPSLMNRSASVVLVRLAPVHFWASHQGLLLVRRCDAARLFLCSATSPCMPGVHMIEADPGSCLQLGQLRGQLVCTVRCWPAAAAFSPPQCRGRRSAGMDA